MEKDKKRKSFIGSVKASKEKRENFLLGKMSLNDAFCAGYLDVSRAPLKGIANMLRENPTIIRDRCIDEFIVPYCYENLFKTDSQNAFDEKHRELCKIIHNYYCENGYKEFSVGKAQKWINMALKYAWIFDAEDSEKLTQIEEYCHVPIDRYISEPIVNELGVDLPEYNGFKMPQARPFSAEKRNYSWSRITDYNTYLECQSKIKNAIKEKDYESALEWEFDYWQKAKEEKSGK